MTYLLFLLSSAAIIMTYSWYLGELSEDNYFRAFMEKKDITNFLLMVLKYTSPFITLFILLVFHSYMVSGRQWG